MNNIIKYVFFSQLFNVTQLSTLRIKFYDAQSFSVVHEDFHIGICSNTEAEEMYGFDNEELWHADFNQKKGVETLPDFGDPMTFPGFYESSVGEVAVCRSNLAKRIKGFKSPPPEMGKT